MDNLIYNYFFLLKTDITSLVAPYDSLVEKDDTNSHPSSPSILSSSLKSLKSKIPP